MSLLSADSHRLSQVSSWRKADVMQLPADVCSQGQSRQDDCLQLHIQRTGSSLTKVAL
ncbi:hypothetical protein [Bradyrhizobium liaoningense]